MINAFRHQRFLHHLFATEPAGILTVINAFRHQRFLHCRWPGADYARSPSDQRLSASKIFAPVRSFRRDSPVSGCDQRLSASKIFARRFFLPPRPSGGVINAFRHQRFLHSLPTCSRTELKAVINAFRHQRFLHLSRAFQEGLGSG